MSSFLPKSWQAKSWRSFSSPSIKQIPSDQMSRLSLEQEQSPVVRNFLFLSSISPSLNILCLQQNPSQQALEVQNSMVSAVNYVGHQHIKWPLLSPLAEEEPGISWLKSCPSSKIKLREKMVRY
jgi:hypothetical protein